MDGGLIIHTRCTLSSIICTPHCETYPSDSGVGAGAEACAGEAEGHVRGLSMSGLCPEIRLGQLSLLRTRRLRPSSEVGRTLA